MGDSPSQLTVLTTRGPKAVKTFRKLEDGSIQEQGYDHAKQFTARVVDMDDGAVLLQRLRSKRHSFLVLGQPIDWQPGEYKLRRSQDSEDGGATLEDTPRRWMPLDIDHLDFEPMAEVDDGEMLALEVMSHLGLKGIQCLWNLTGSHGVEGKRRIRLWVKLKRPLTCAQMRKVANRWSGLVDSSIYKPAQPLYIGDPVFIGMESPVRERVGFVEGEPLDIQPPTAELQSPRSGPADDLNIQMLIDAGLYEKSLGAGRHAIRCPWNDEHTTGAAGNTSTVYLQPNFNGFTTPNFHCFHDSCQRRKWPDVLAVLGKPTGNTKGSFEPVTGDTAKNPAAQVRSVDDFVAHLPGHDYIFTLTMAHWSASSVDACVPKVRVGDKAMRASAWLDKNRPVHAETWCPGYGLIIEGKVAVSGGWKEDPNARCVNTYAPPRPLDGDPAEAQTWIDHLRKTFPNDADHIIRYFAHRVQKPGEKINHALVIAGDQGIGKDTLIEPLKRAIGEWNFQEVGPPAIIGSFNGFVKSVVLRVSEGRDLGDTDRFAFYEHMKTLTAAPPDTLRCNEKHAREHYVFNVMGVIITTNHRSDGIYLPQDDRRHYVATSSLNKDDFDAAYWKRLWGWYHDHNGFGHVAAYLRSVDLSDFDPAAPPARTSGWHTIVAANNAPEDIELCTAIEELGEPDALTVEMLRNVGTEELMDYLDDRRNRRSIGHRLVLAGYVPVRNPDAKNGLWRLPSPKSRWQGLSSKTKSLKGVAFAKRTLTPADAIRAVREMINSKPKATRKHADDAI